MKKNKIIYYVATSVLTLILLFSVNMYFFKHEAVAKMFTGFGYPTYIIYPYAVLKLLGLIVLWSPGLKTMKEWVYSAFFFAFTLAFFAHYMISDGEQMASVIAIVSLLVSYLFYKKINSTKAL